ncbi:MAG: 2-C-methyl-D-erythritol 4-phosphate cytidylyltransferase [Mucilaginibacter polytrichastri]|nr:2-C-methyl-D-erythritol 4-phosphate cytidylyltransferase [Mucilaginibacter polytrichastri]
MTLPADFPPCYAVIVAGGSGNRMKSDRPKQFLLLDSRPVLMHTLEAFTRSRYSPKIILVLSKAWHQHWRNLCEEHAFTLPCILAEGGESRFHSVKSGLGHVPDNALVAVHDGARPLTGASLIDACYRSAQENGNGVAALAATDTVRLVENAAYRQLNRQDVYLMQTPQTFRSTDLKAAYALAFTEDITDDACVWERAGNAIVLVEGERSNIKITWPDDLAYAGFLLAQKKPY